MKDADPATQGSLDVFERSCGYCGARFRVLTSHEHPHREAYACPECDRHYETQADGTPEVQLVRPRSDGKDDRYQETMF
jgi:hypothetical protein